MSSTTDPRRFGTATRDSPGVSVLIVNWNSGRHLSRCLASLPAGACSTVIEVIVVDNLSSDDSIAAARRVMPDARFIVNGTNRGLAAANNQAIAIARAPYVLISNPDVEYGEGSIDALVSLLDRHPSAAIAVPRLVHGDGTLHTSVGDLPTLPQALLGRRIGSWRGRRGGFWWDDWPHDRETKIGRGHEAAYLVRRAAIDHVGAQDDRFFLDWEGIEWTARFRDRGWEVWFTPEARAVHHEGVSVRQAQVRWILTSHAGMYRYFAVRQPVWARPALALVVAARALIKLAAFAVTRDVYPKLTAGGR